jgi:hypothetical protein
MRPGGATRSRIREVAHLDRMDQDALLIALRMSFSENR